MSEWDWIHRQTEGQFFERKSCIDQTPARRTRRAVREVAKDIAETLAAMANSDGGTLVVGVENDGVVTGVDFPSDRLDVLRKAPQTHVKPPLQPRVFIGELAGKQVMIFEVDWSPEVHQLADGRYLLRIGDRNMPFPAQDIEALKAGKRRRVVETQTVPAASLADLDLTLVSEVAESTGLDVEPEEILERYRLIERRNGRYALTLAALLLFARDPGKWHAHCDIDFVKYEGKERRTGTSLNIIKRERIEAPLVRLIQRAYNTIQPHVRERQQLIDLFFEERLEYPTFAWQEAIVNAVAHRDYRFEGLGIEIWMFDDRIEIRSPGELVEPVTLERLKRRERIHASRNPRIVRVLTDLGYMREQGEGVPRMFELMEKQGLYPPEFQLEAGTVFTVTLRNTPIYSPATLRWLSQYEALDLSGNQKRLLVYAREHGNTFTSRLYQQLVGIELYAASRDIKELRRKGIVQQSKKGGRIYLLTDSRSLAVMPSAEEFDPIRSILEEKGQVTNRDVREALQVSRRRAGQLLQEWVATGYLARQGRGRGAHYILGNEPPSE